MEVEPSDGLSLLDTLESMVEIEQSLSAQMEKVEPWLLQNTKNPDPNRSRVRPIPQTLEQVHHILAVARNLASRTSAPAAWNPAAPVVGFSTPNPLPHQLRGGALAALQLDRARQAERDKKRKEVDSNTKSNKEQQASKKNKKEEGAGTDAQQHRAQAARRARAAGEAHARRNPQQQLTTMNLSESSSSDDEEDDDDSDSD